MKIGYARVSTTDQNLELQINALLQEGCEKIYQEKISATKERPELKNLLDYVRAGDVVVVWKLDRLGRNLKELIFLIEELMKRNVDFKCITNKYIDTTSPTGKMHYQLIAVFAEYERNIIVERTKAGLDAAKKKGIVLGRKPGLSKKSKEKAKLAAQLYKNPNRMSIRKIAALLDISTATLYRYLEIEGVELNNKKKPFNEKP